MAEIKHFVVLMMENRSFDHMLGFLKSPEYPIDGLTGDESNTSSAGVTTKANRSARYSGDLIIDPRHDFWDVSEQLFGTSTPAPEQTADMSGFVRNYEHYASISAGQIMNCFDPAALPVLATLAREYAVCDRWFSSVPGPTLPNRLYVHAGTSRGRLDMSPDYFSGFRSLYEVLWNHAVDSTIFLHDWSATLTFEFMMTHQSDMYATFNRFTELCRSGRLPSYSFIEPQFNSAGADGSFLPANDQHPDHDVAAGEMLIRRVYEALRSNDDVWKSCLLLIVYDEHGGTYDHVPPGSCESPDGLTCVAPPFDFTRYGPRVPAVVVSPYVKRGTIVHDRTFDHTSIIATAMRLFAGDSWPSDILGRRAMKAAPIDDLLDLTAPPRMDTPQFAPHPIAATIPQPLPGALSALQKEAIDHATQLEARLPESTRTGIDPHSVGDEHQAGIYLSAVSTAALQAKRNGSLVK
jgi:phospholipase C